MSTKDFTANVISATKVVPDGNFKDSKASGIWDINEALDLIKGGNWPNAANINPSAFVDGLFSTFVYDGTSDTSLAINNGLDLTKGGLVWTKERTGNGGGNILFSTDASGNHSGLLFSNTSASAGSGYQPDYFTFRNNGYTTTNTVGDSKVNGREYVSWSFRNQPKFFDIVTYTGNGTAGKTVAHNLGSVPGMIMVKVTSTSDSWALYHRGSNGGTDPEDYMLRLNTTDTQANNADYWNDTAPTDSVFTLGTDPGVNGNGVSYVAYLFAHNNDDGGFGEPGDQDIIKCGTYTGNGSTTGTVVNLGFEPQFIMLKRTDDTENAHWYVFDSMRGMVTGGDDPYLYWNNTNAEVAGNALEVTPTGFQLKATGTGFNGSNATYVYMAIRRGGMQTPTAASSVFGINEAGTNDSPTNNFTVGFDPDMNINTTTAGNQKFILTRLIGTNFLKTNATSAQTDQSDASFFGGTTGTIDLNTDFFATTSTVISWSWKRARGYFDVVAYTGDGATNHNVSHNLGVSPEMIWIKNRGDSTNWVVWHKDLSSGKYLRLESTAAELNQSGILGTASVSATTFPVGSNSDNTNKSSNTYISYLFATVAGVSKVGSYTGNGNATGTTVDCGFTNGVKWVLFKRTSGQQNWYIYDTTRGLTSGDDKGLELNSTASEATAQVLNSTSSGFQLATTSSFANENNSTFIFYAIANDP